MIFLYIIVCHSVSCTPFWTHAHVSITEWHDDVIKMPYMYITVATQCGHKQPGQIFAGGVQVHYTSSTHYTTLHGVPSVLSIFLINQVPLTNMPSCTGFRLNASET